MSSMLRTVAFVGLAALLWGVSAPLIAQTAPTSGTTTVNRPLTAKPDLSLLAEATTNFLKGEAFQTESITEISSTGRASEFKVQFRTTTIAQAPDRFRAEISLVQPSAQAATTATDATATEANKTLVISDGRVVWIYRPDLKQYTSMPYPQFDRRNDTFSVGMSSMLFLLIAPELQPLARQGLLTDETVKAQLNALSTADLKGGAQRIKGEDLFVYEYRDRQNRYRYSAAIHPLDKTLRQVELTGNAAGSSFTLTEMIQKRIANPPVIADTFRFTPPQDAKQVGSLEIMPF